MTTRATQSILDMQLVTKAPPDVVATQQAALAEYEKNAPRPHVLDVLEDRKLSGKISVIRQVRPGTYTHVEDDRLVTTSKATSKP